MRTLFAHFGLPKWLVSDNGPQKNSDFMAVNGMQHVRSAPYHPATNGAAERSVQTFKQALRAGRRPRKFATKVSSFSDDVQKYTTFHSTTGVTPAELFLRRPRTHLDVMRPLSGEHVLLKQMDQKRFHDRRQPCEFLVGQAVWVRNVRDGLKWWVERCVLRNAGPVSYEVNVDGQVWKCHADQCYVCLEVTINLLMPMSPL